MVRLDDDTILRANCRQKGGKNRRRRRLSRFSQSAICPTSNTTIPCFSSTFAVNFFISNDTESMRPLFTHRLFFTFLFISLLLSGCRKDADTREGQPQRTEVGSGACASCHAEIYRSYVRTGMGRSFSIPDPKKISPLLKSGTSIYEPKSNFHYEVFLRNGVVVMREFRKEGSEIVYEQERTASYQVGSGNNTVSFIQENNGYLFEMPLTWYSGKRIWDLSPGYRQHNWRFDRPISAACMNCHNSPTRRTPHTENHFEKIPMGIGCENCHGAGSEHITLALEGKLTKGSKEQAILNPASFGREVQMDVCQRCHLEGVAVWNSHTDPHEVDITRPLVTFKNVVGISSARENEAEFAIAAQAGRLMKSACYRESGTLTCTTCHDPHRTPDVQGRIAFNTKCQSCHNDTALHTLCTVKLPVGKQKTDCISCHMNVGGTSDIPHVSFTDHFIRKNIRVNRTPSPSSGKEEDHLPSLVPTLMTSDHTEGLRVLGMAYYEYFQHERPDNRYLDSVIFYVEAALASTPPRPDGEDLFALGSAYYLLNRPAMAESAFRRLLDRNKSHARGQYLLGRVLLSLDKVDDAIASFSNGVKSQPLLVENYLGLAQAYLQKREFDSALFQVSRGIELDSLSYPEAFFLRGQIEHNRGNLHLARLSYADALQRNPDHEGALLNLGGTFLTQERWEYALRFFDQILKSNPRNAPALNNKLVCLVNLKRTAEAVETAQQLLHLQPNNQEIRQLLQDLRR